MTDYSIPDLDDPKAIGSRARRLRDLLGMTIDQLANKAKVAASEVEALERDGNVTLSTALAIHKVLSGASNAETLFTRPRLRNLDEAEAFEKRRQANR